ncbi:PREDICTED: centrosomal protein of 112 kDa isoform X4 [Sturnus vulgaris]|uniref:centrosomal protein of 112 kDa isoform X4 n=1 Tax=Sturnus vulgaris TaxID=9172 RepID=UPI00071A46EB|nr:PREDICTED: centrosomal protein of 112 kDa isoform X4 [Sturnus vulgaris]
MSSEDEIKEKLDAELDRCIVAMKPYVLNLQHRSERKRCSLWIKKLCKPSGAGIGIVGRENRNLYAKLLLHMLQRGVLNGPFSQKPEEGMLKTLPPYMSVYFDEPRILSSSPDRVPEWVMGELGNHGSNASSVGDSSSATPAAHGERLNEKPSVPSRCVSSPQHTDEDDLGTSLSDDQHKRNFSLDDDDLEARLNSWNLGLENPRYLREKRVPMTVMTPKIGLEQGSPSRHHQALFRTPERELEMKMKIAEGKFHEEKLKLQQKHDADVQKILDRKNDEIDVLKSTYINKQKESEDTIRKLEKKVQTLVRESQIVREAKEQQIVELKKMCEQSNDCLKNEWEKKLHDAVAEMEKEKFNIRKKHMEDMHELLQETNARLARMEEEYLQQTKATNETVQKLGARVQQLTVEAENSNLQRQKLCQEKTEVEQRYQEVCSQLQELRTRYNLLQKDKEQIMQEYKENLQQLQSKFDVDRDFMKQEQAQQTSDVIAELQRGMALLKQQLQDSELKRQQQLRDQEHKVEQDKLHMQRAYEKQIHGIQNDLDKERGDAQKKIHHLEQALKEKEEQLRRVTEVQRLQAQQAGAALEEFKRQVELNSEKDSAEMKQRIAEVEADLSRSKLLREKQAQEFSKQLDEIRKIYEQQIVELKLEHEQEKTHLFQQHNAVQDCLVRDHQWEIEKLEKQLRGAMAEHESQSHESRKRDGQVISSLENQIHKLREDLIQANALRTHQLLDLSLQRDEEKLKAARDKEAALNSLKMEMEKVISDLKMKHTAETEAALNKANSRLKQTEEHFSQKLAKSSQEIAELKKTISSLREENRLQQLAAQQRLQEVAQKLEEEKQQLIADNDRAIKLITMREEYEKILKGLIPASSKKELEDTIASLKSQVSFLQKRVLQEDLNAHHAKK